MKKNAAFGPWKQQGIYHLLIWSIFITYELLCIVATVGLAAPYLHYVFYYLLYIGLFYCNAHLILDYCFFRNRRPYLIAVILVLLEILIFGMIKALIDGALNGGPGHVVELSMFSKGYILANLFRQIFFIGFSIAYWSMLYLTRFRNKAQQLEIEQLKQQARALELENKYMSAENAFLQNQISPHLLFNSLNFIYYTVYRLSDRAGRGIMLLSGLLRYSLSFGTGQRFVSLDKEVEQVQNLIELDRMRFKGERYLGFERNGKLSGRRILPLVLVTLVENIIKHGECGLADEPALARLSVAANQLRFTTVNKKRESSPYPATGLGLNNLRKRLNNAYAGRFELHILDEGNWYKVYLTIDL